MKIKRLGDFIPRLRFRFSDVYIGYQLIFIVGAPGFISASAT